MAIQQNGWLLVEAVVAVFWGQVKSREESLLLHGELLDALQQELLEANGGLSAQGHLKLLKKEAGNLWCRTDTKLAKMMKIRLM